MHMSLTWTANTVHVKIAKLWNRHAYDETKKKKKRKKKGHEWVRDKEGERGGKK